MGFLLGEDSSVGSRRVVHVKMGLGSQEVKLEEWFGGVSSEQVFSAGGEERKALLVGGSYPFS